MKSMEDLKKEYSDIDDETFTKVNMICSQDLYKDFLHTEAISKLISKLYIVKVSQIENGVKYNHENGWVRVTLKFDHKFFYVTVSDSGMGIPEEQLERVFERFYRGDQSHSTTIEGTGLGLAITRDIVALHRGTVKVESTVGEGSEFTVRIPLINDEAGKV